MESYIVDCLTTNVAPIAYSYNELPETTPDVYSLKRKRGSRLTCDEPSRITKPPTNMAKTVDMLSNTMGPEA